MPAVWILLTEHRVGITLYDVSGDGGNQLEKDGKGCGLQYIALGAYG